MLSYNTRNWFQIIFDFRKADTISKLLPLMLIVAAYSTGIVYLLSSIFHLPDSSPLKNFLTLHSILGFVISMLLVFRTNTAYDRWWEGRRQWGALVNSSRNFSLKINAFLPHDDTKNRGFFRTLVPLFATALCKHLRAETTRLELTPDTHPEIPNFDHTKHVPNQIVSLLVFKLNLLYKEGTITGDQFIIINNELQSFTDVCGACERIKNTPIPYSYSAFIKKFIFLYVITLPLGLTFSLHYLLIPVVTIIFYVLASLELIAEEIEDPFGDDPNDLPLEILADKIKQNVLDIIR